MYKSDDFAVFWYPPPPVTAPPTGGGGGTATTAPPQISGDFGNLLLAYFIITPLRDPGTPVCQGKLRKLDVETYTCVLEIQ